MSMKRTWHSAGTLAVLAGTICLLVYLRALACGFVDYDDPEYVLNNPLIRSLDRHMLVQAFREQHVGWWMPLTWISFAVDFRFWGLNPQGYHLTNILLHAANTGLVVLVADRVMRGHGAADKGQDGCLYPLTLLLAGLLWGIHPLRVESVAWVTERKDVLNGLFALSSLLAYLAFAEKREAGRRAWPSYLASLVLFACSLMAKSVTVVLPLLLLVLDRYPLGRTADGRLPGLLLEKLPFLVLSLLMTLITVIGAGSGDFVVLVSSDVFPWHERILVSGNAILQYVRYLFWPAGITPYHVIPDPVPMAPYAVATLVVACFTVLVLWNMRGRAWAGSVWLLFVIPLLPVLAFLQNGDQGYAARFTYLPALAPGMAGAFLLRRLYARLEGRRVLRGAVALTVTLLLSASAAMSYRLITVWDSGETMWTRVIEHAPSSSAYWRRGLYRHSTGSYRAAAADYSAAIELVSPVWRPHVHNLYAHRGESLLAAGSYGEAVADLTAAISRYPHPLYFRLRGEALGRLGRAKDAEADLARAGDERGPLGWYFEPLPEPGGR